MRVPLFRSLFVATAAGALVALASAGAQAALPSPWTNVDIGAVGSPGATNGSGTSYSVAGAGADIGGTADAFQYMYQRLNGNGQLVARVDSLQNTNAAAKAGVMIRQDLTATSPHALVAVTPGSGVTFVTRTATGGASSSSTTAGIVAPRWLKIARSGDVLRAFQSPDGATWTAVGAARTIAMPAVIYVGLAVTSHVAGTNNNALFSNVQTQGNPALFVVGSTSLNAGDAMAKRRLESLGYVVTVKAAPSSSSSDAAGKDLVVISSTVTGTDVNTKFKSVTVPVITWEPDIFKDMGLTGSAVTEFGTATGQTSAVIASAACDRATMYTAAKGFADGCHDMAAGLSGTVAVYKQAAALTWGKPAAAAVKIATLSSDTTKAILFGYDKGATLASGIAAPERRVALFVDSTSASVLTGRGVALFDRAVHWATATRYTLTKNVLGLIYDPILRSQGNARLSAYGTGRWGFWAGDPSALFRNYLADITESSGGYVRWKLAENTGPRVLDAWVPITASVQFNSAGFTEQDFLNAYALGPESNPNDWVGAGQHMPDGGAYSVDYNRLLDDNAVDAKVASGAVDEVVVYAMPFGGFSESAMAGATPFQINGAVVFRNAPNYVVMGLSYERGLGEAIESFGHRVEWLLDRHTFRIDATASYNPCFWALPSYPDSCGGRRQPPPTRNIYDFFTYVEGISPGEGALGGAHWAVNATNFLTDEYRWDLPNTVWSHAPDWAYNYPALTGLKEVVGRDTWRPMAQDGEYGRGWKKFWFQHMPHVPGLYRDANNATNNGKLNNWWEYTVNFNRHPETQQ
jgi:hypothetical protein